MIVFSHRLDEGLIIKESGASFSVILSVGLRLPVIWIKEKDSPTDCIVFEQNTIQGRPSHYSDIT